MHQHSAEAAKSNRGRSLERRHHTMHAHGSPAVQQQQRCAQQQQQQQKGGASMHSAGAPAAALPGWSRPPVRQGWAARRSAAQQVGSGSTGFTFAASAARGGEPNNRHVFEQSAARRAAALSAHSALNANGQPAKVAACPVLTCAVPSASSATTMPLTPHSSSGRRPHESTVATARAAKQGEGVLTPSAKQLGSLGALGAACAHACACCSCPLTLATHTSH